MSIIYGVDTTKPYTAIDVRDAVVDCFVQAHKEVLESDMGEFAKELKPEEFKKFKEINVCNMVRKFFEETGGDYDKPTKKSIVAICNKLAEFAKNFRSPEIIQKHYGEIMGLVKGLEE